MHRTRGRCGTSPPAPWGPRLRRYRYSSLPRAASGDAAAGDRHRPMSCPSCHREGHQRSWRDADGGTWPDRTGQSDHPSPPHDPPISHAATLTRREAQVLGLVAMGLTNSAIAAEMGITRAGVEKHLTNVFGKLRVGDAVDLNPRVAATRIWLGVDQPRP